MLKTDETGNSIGLGDDILIVDDNKDILGLLSELLEKRGYSTRTASNGEECFKAVNEYLPSLILLDLWLEDADLDGLRIMKELKENNPDIPIIIITAHGSIEIVSRAMRMGAYDFVEKPIRPDFLITVIGRTMETVRLRRENAALRLRGGIAGEIIGSSQVANKIRNSLDRVARSNARVLIHGPPGSGKEHAARYIHAKSPRAQEPFVDVIPGAMEKDELERALFGYRKNGSIRTPGMFEQAHRGTIFFDQVEDLPMELQPKLLKTLVCRQFNRVGDENMVRVDFRVISSTSKDMEKEIAEGRFLKDLYDRLNVYTVEVPSLNSRRSDIPELAQYFMDQFHRGQGLPARTLTKEAMDFLEGAEWPKNVRQLKNIVERVLLMNESDGPIKASEFEASSQQVFDFDFKSISGHLVTMTLRDAREQFEREYLVTQINRFDGNISRAAHFIGMERSALHRKLRSLQVITTAKAGNRRAVYENGDENFNQPSECA